MNLVFAITDLFLCGFDFRFRFVPVFVAYVCLYVAFAWIRFSFVGEFPYGFLDYRRYDALSNTYEKKKPLTVVLYYLGVGVWAIIAGACIAGLSRMKHCCAHCCGNSSFDKDVEEDVI